jgi:hypothetical protein
MYAFTRESMAMQFRRSEGRRRDYGPLKGEEGRVRCS